HCSGGYGSAQKMGAKMTRFCRASLHCAPRPAVSAGRNSHMARPGYIDVADLDFLNDEPDPMADELSTGQRQALREAVLEVPAPPFGSAEAPPNTIKVLALPVMIFRG